MDYFLPGNPLDLFIYFFGFFSPIYQHSLQCRNGLQPVFETRDQGLVHFFLCFDLLSEKGSLFFHQEAQFVAEVIQFNPRFHQMIQKWNQAPDLTCKS